MEINVQPIAIQTIETNYKELKNQISVALKKYEDISYTEENLKLAKQDRATLNKFKDAMEAKRIEVKKECMKPYESFEKQVKDLVGMVQNQINTIDTVVKEYDTRKRNEKKIQILEYFMSEVGELAPIVSMERIFSDKWLNASVALTTIQSEIMDKLKQIKTDIEVIGSLKSKYEAQIMDTYLRSYNLSLALSESKRLEEQEARLQAYAEMQAAQAAEASTIALSSVATNDKPVTAEQTNTSNPNTEIPLEATTEATEAMYHLTLRLSGTKEQLVDLRKYLDSNNIKFEKVG